MRADDLRELMDDIEASELDESAKEAARLVIRQFATRRGMSAFDREEQVAFVQHLRMIGERREVIRDRLIARFGISRSTAYTRICEALQLSGKLHIFRTDEADHKEVPKSN